jgi:hypothetical protein
VTALLWFLVFEVPICCAVTLYLIYRMFIFGQEIMARVIGKRASDFADALADAEARVTEVARYGVRARSGPARLRDQDSPPAR